MTMLASLTLCLCLVGLTGSSLLTTPPQSAVVVAFEDVYDLSLLANTLSDQGIDTTLIIPAAGKSELYESLIDVEVLTIGNSVDGSASAERRAFEACEILLTDEMIAQKIQQIQPTFAIFPALRHDSCLIPWAKFIAAIPVIYTRNSDEEKYVFRQTGAAVSVTNADSMWGALSEWYTQRSLRSTVEDEYGFYALRIVEQHLPDIDVRRHDLYRDVRLILWGFDVVLRSDFAPLTQLLVEVGCHHCRGAFPLPDELQKSLVEYRQGTVVAFLDTNYKWLIRELAESLPQGRDGQAVVWKNKKWVTQNATLPTNLFVHTSVDRQDLIGYKRTWLLLSHCADTELLEAAFHGTPVICFPRNDHEATNAARAIDLGFAVWVDRRDKNFFERFMNAVGEIQETRRYRDNAMKTSVAIRDRLEPASDRLMFWLRYMARTKDENFEFHAAMSPAKTVYEDAQFVVALAVGAVVGVVATLFCILRYVDVSRKKAFKGRYSR